jgi:predicted ATPase
VPLASVDDPELVASTISHELGLPERGGVTPVARIVENIRDRELLLVLDNFEQVVAAAPTIAKLLAGIPRLAVLVTTRSVLHLYGEQEYPVPPLAMPDPRHLPDRTQLLAYEAVALFVARATAVLPAFTITTENAAAVAEICRRLDGLPLAIELAAARIRVLTPQQIVVRLERRLALLAGPQDLPDRQRTLNGAIGWSHEMLDERERRLFACLSVFVGGARLDAIESTCGSDGDDALELLTALVDKSLVRRVDGSVSESRFEMLETIREYAAERLEESGMAADLRRRHADLFVSLAEEAAASGLAAGQREWLDRLEEEHGNFRAVLMRAIADGDAERAMRLCVALWRFWQMRGYLVQGAAMTRQTLALPGCPEYADLRLATLEALGGLLYWMGAMDEAKRYYEEALAIVRERGDVSGEANALYNLSFTFVYLDRPDLESGRLLAEQALELYERVGDRRGVAKALWAVANAAYGQGDGPQVREYTRRALPIFRELGDSFLIGWGLFLQAGAEILDDDGDLALSRHVLGEALGIFRDANDVSGLTLILDALASLDAREGNMQDAARASGAVHALERATGTGLNPISRTVTGFDPGSLRDDPSTSDAWAEGARMAIDEALQLAANETKPRDRV